MPALLLGRTDSVLLLSRELNQEGRFKKLCEKPQLFNDQEQAKSLIEAGDLAISNKNFDRLKEINWGLISLLPKNIQQDAKIGRIGF